ncbi:Ribulose bisphosphate carboxylase/oxygenase activase [Cladobotryum mycophilum]|uniref:Ribulose bisphosphate carboxylase/oxygenase activase n=1 Tax=Cladobotryum mycophilum TaxID=491253 RepID=A0ABR0SGA8_9HYPO
MEATYNESWAAPELFPNGAPQNEYYPSGYTQYPQPPLNTYSANQGPYQNLPSIANFHPLNPYRNSLMTEGTQNGILTPMANVSYNGNMAQNNYTSYDNSNNQVAAKIDVQNHTGINGPGKPFQTVTSMAAQEWDHRKRVDGERSDVLDKLMKYQGLEEVKQQFLDIKSKVDVYKKQDPDGKLNRIKSERFNIIFQGNPGTGKTTVARLYAKFLNEMGILQSKTFKETTGMKVATMGAAGIQQYLNDGVLFIDEAYQLTASYIDGVGRQALDLILTEMENRISKLAVIFVGYKEEMESFFEHNPGLASRIPYTMNFADFDDGDLWQILVQNIRRTYGGNMFVDGGLDGLYMRIAIRRLAQGRRGRGFGNARAVENLLSRIAGRQAQRLTQEKRQGYCTAINYFFFTKEDVIGPDPSVAVQKCQAWSDLKELIGLKQVKDCVEQLVGMLKLNYWRELHELSPLKFSLNQVFVGSPGAGKTTVAKLYGRILADLGYLTRGDVVMKGPADFIGDCLGKSEAKTKSILEATVGKVLVIDEAYMLDAGDPNKEQDKFKTGVIDTIVSMIQGVPGEDRCIVLVGYEDKIRDMFRNVNPGLSRRFPIERPFRFENFDLDQLEKILRLKLRNDDLEATEDAIYTARNTFENALMRPNFSNAGEVDKILGTAKLNYQTRLSNLGVGDNAASLDGREDIFKLYPQDFDPDFDRGGRQDLDCGKLLDGRVQRNIIDKLVTYQEGYHKAKQLNWNPREHIPTNFVFKGPSGTGKSTTAQHMGQMFYNMGFLSDKKVIECSATDLIGQYVGHTAPKTRKKLQEGLGHVLLIDEVHRLTSSTYAQEAVDELIQFLTQPSNVGKMVIVLAGYTDDVHKLMGTNPTLSSLFPEELVFETITPDDCIRLLGRELWQLNIGTVDNFLNMPDSQNYIQARRLFNDLSLISGWGNARDVKTLAKEMARQFLNTVKLENSQLELSFESILKCINRMIEQRKSRQQTLDSDDDTTPRRRRPL